MGSPDAAPDRRHGRRRSADQQGRGASVRRAGRTPTSTICSCRWWSTRRASIANQNCGNILAGVGPYAIEHGLVACARRDDRRAHPHGQHQAVSPSPRSRRRAASVAYEGDARIDGVPGHGGADPARLPRHRRARAAERCCRPATRATRFHGVEVTCIDNGMPVVLMRAARPRQSRRRAPGGARGRQPR